MILYPTETIYGLGVDALDETAVRALFAFKGREGGKGVSWLVRDIADIEKYAELSDVARKMAERYLPGPVTLVVPAGDAVARHNNVVDGCLSFRISSDPVAQKLIAEFMAEHDAPLTCTSANVSGQETGDSPTAILEQFQAARRDVSQFTKVIDDGPRTGQGSTVVRIIGDEVEVLRQGSIIIDPDLLS